MSVVVATHLSHPALLPPSPPMTPPQLTTNLPLPKAGAITPRPPPAHTAKPKTPSPKATTIIAPPLPCYSMLRSQHATAIRYVIAKLRWDQMHNGYIPGCDPWEKIAIVIQKLEDELAGVEAAQKTLDIWPNLHHPIAPTAKDGAGKPFGPMSRDELREAEEKERVKELALDKQLYQQFPFLKQAFVGPKTKNQAKAHVEMRKVIFEGDFYMDDLEEMMPEENLKAAMNGESIDPYRKKPTPPPAGRAVHVPTSKPKRLTYDEARCERENAKIQEQLKEKGIEVPPLNDRKANKLIGPMTKEEWLASLPRYGPKTKGEAMLPIQREQRQMILAWLKQPWPVYDEEAAALIHKLGTMAFVRLEEKARAAKGGGPRRRSTVHDRKPDAKTAKHDDKDIPEKPVEAGENAGDKPGDDKDKQGQQPDAEVVKLEAVEVEVIQSDNAKLQVQVVEVADGSEKPKKVKID